MFVERLEPRRLLTGTLSEQIIVDQFGWRANAAKKVVLFADPISGQNAAVSYTPGSTFEVRRVGTDLSVFTGSVVAASGGVVNTVSGDIVWRGDFSSVTAPGEYYIYDPANDKRSYNFILNDDVFNDVMTASTRTYFYQRQSFAITSQYGGNWTHALDHTKDQTALLWNGSAIAGTARNVSGGWYDAGDYNKYVPFTTNPLWNLLTAYEWNPAAFTDRTNIPESGNGVPDVLDEVKWELEWLRKMQLGDGSVLNRVANQTYSAGNADPATDTQNRYYTAATTWATASFAASLAHASRVFQSFDATYASTLLTAATNAWNYLSSHTSMLPASGNDGGGSGGGAGNLAAAAAGANAGYDLRLRILASAELFKTTGIADYRTYFDANYASSAAAEGGFQPMLASPKYLDASLALDLNHAYMTYATATGATSTVVTNIKSAVQGVDQSWLAPGQYLSNSDPYRGFMWEGHYTWGSNQLKAEWGNLLLYAYKLNVTPANSAKYLEAAEEYLHYFHGRNPLSEVYLSNMGTKGANLGADKSPLEIYHSWYADGSSKYDGAASLYGPAPGYLVGGPNNSTSGGVAPPTGEPSMKAFRDWNNSSQASWEVTEPAIYYQAAYTLLLSQFATTQMPTWLKYIGGGALNSPVGPTATYVATGGTINIIGDMAAGLAREFSVLNAANVKLFLSQSYSVNVFVATTAKLDIADKSFAVKDPTGQSPIGTWNGSAYTGITGSIVQGRNGGNWNGNGITTSSPTSGAYKGIGIATGSTALGLSGSATAVWNGQTVSATTTLVRYTYVGDANLDGRINGDDYFKIDAGFSAHSTGYGAGDFNYDGKINADDYFLIDSNYNHAQAQLAGLVAGESEIPPASAFSRPADSAYSRLFDDHADLL